MGMELTFAEWMIVTRRRLGLSQAQLGQRVGIDQRMLSLFERGHARPTEDQERVLRGALLSEAEKRNDGAWRADSA
jgi:transcriptional regulator with XRE-family HTH domain